MNSEVYGSEQTVRHENEVASVGIGNGEPIFWIEKSCLSIRGEGFPAVANEKIPNLGLTRCRGASDGGLLNDQSVAIWGWHNAEETDLIGEECVVKQPSLQLVNGRGL